MSAAPVQPATELLQVGVPGYDASKGGNVIAQRVGLNFAVVPNIFGYTVVSAPGPIDTPVAVKQFASQVVSNHMANPTPFTSFIPQSACLCFQDAHKGLLADQSFTDSQGVDTFSLQEVNPFCGLGEAFCPMICGKRVTAFNAQRQEIGHLKWRKPTCGMQISQCLCAVVCRSPSWPEWAWLSAVDPSGQVEKLTFRYPATEGQCLLFKYCHCYKPAEHGCCYIPPDVPFKSHMTLHGSVIQCDK